jgi:hypothetical protein
MGRQRHRIGTLGQKSTLTEIDCRTLKRIVSKNHTTLAQLTAELNTNLEDPVSTITVLHELHKFNSRAAVAEPLITESTARIRKRWCYHHKTWTSDNWKRVRDMGR